MTKTDNGQLRRSPGRTFAQHCLLASIFVILATAGSSNIFATFGKERTLSLYNIHNSESLNIVYKRNGKLIPSAQKQLNHFMRDWRTNDPTKMDPKLFDILWEIHTELGSKKPIHLISGYRSRKTNNRLRRRGGGQAKNSRHVLGKATDVHFPDIPAKKIRYSALIRQNGGVGYYPNSALPFVHIDTGSVRHWPRMPRYELALLFPDGKSKHVPSGGRRINKNDVRIAKKRHKQMAQQIAAFHQFRAQPKTNIMVASLDPITTLLKAPKLMGLGGHSKTFSPRTKITRKLLAPQPRLLKRASEKSQKPTRMAALDPAIIAALGGNKPLGRTTARLNPPLPTKRIINASPKTATTTKAVAVLPPSLAPRSPSNDPIHWPTGFAGSPEFDDEHPNELSYRPFAVAPLLTETASIDDPTLSYLTHPENKGIMDTIASGDDPLPLKFQPGLQFAELLWADRFAGNAVAVANLLGLQRDHTGRRIQTARQ